jgi:PAS domain S-box-containing protein
MVETGIDFERFAQESLDLMCLARTDGFFQWVNASFERVLGWSREDLLARPFISFVHPDDVAATLSELDNLKRGELTLGFNNRYQCRDGSWRWLEWSVSPAGDGTSLYCNARDVTVLRYAIEDLERERSAARVRERRLELAVAATSDAIWEWNLETGETFYSPRWYEMLGLADQGAPMTFDTWKALCHPDDFQPTVDKVKAAMAASGRNRYEVEFRMRHRDGSWIWILGRGNVVVHDPRGRPLILSGTNTDITERKRVEERLRQAEKMESVGRMAGGVAHDFNNLLTAIRGNVSVAMMNLQPEDPHHELLGEAIRAVDSAANLTRQLLAFARKQVVMPRVLDLNGVVSRLLEMLRRLLGEDVLLEASLDAGVGRVKMDAGQLEQIVVNLALNARDAMPGGGKLTITTSNLDLDPEAALHHPGATAGRYVKMAMTDTGMGMSEDARAHLFEPFFTTKEVGKGTGLGLAMAYGAVHQNEGTIEVATQPGRGTTFSILLPRVDAPPEAVPIAQRPHLAGGSETILLVEDEGVVRDIAQRILKRLGYTVHAFAGGEEALAALPELPAAPALLLTDVVMPGMSGQALATRVKAMRPNMKVLFTSGYNEEVTTRGGSLEPHIEFLPKPYSIDQLAGRVREVLDASSA